MGAGRLGGLTALCLVLVAGAASAQTAQVAIDSCVKKLNPEIDVGYERIAARCPDLARRLDESGESVWLPRDWKRAGNDLSAGGLRELGNLLAWVAGDTASAGAGVGVGAHQLNIDHLPSVLAGLAGSGAVERNGWWARTKAWLRDVFGRREAEDDDWFSRVVGQNGLSQAVIELISYAALVLVVVLAVAIVLNELLLDGVLGRLRRRWVVRGRRGFPPGGQRSLTLESVQRAPAVERPRMLLELIVSRLTAEGRLPSSRGLTIRELTRAARLHDEVDRERLAQLARVSEQMRFSNGPASGEAVASALEGGRMLLQRVSAGADAGEGRLRAERRL